MKYILFIFLFSIALANNNCKTSNNNQNNNNTEKSLVAKHISRIELLVDSSIELPDARHKEIDIGYSFVDSLGNLTSKPHQIINISGKEKDSLLSIFNQYLNLPFITADSTKCIIVYTHVFNIYNKGNELIEKIYFAFNCPMSIYYQKMNVNVQPSDSKSDSTLIKFTAILQSLGVRIPTFGPPPPPPPLEEQLKKAGVEPR